MEKRNSIRYHQEASLVCSIFNSGNQHEGNMKNFSKDGMYFEQNVFFKPGTAIAVRIEECPFEMINPDILDELNTVALADVRWYQDFGEYNKPRFGYGVRYLTHF